MKRFFLPGVVIATTLATALVLHTTAAQGIHHHVPKPMKSLTLPPDVLGRLSTRGAVTGTGIDALVAGFIITGSGQKRFLFRALGPSLGLPGVVADPRITLNDTNGPIATNDNWMSSPDRAEILATGYAPPDNLESAGVVTLSPGAYTMVVEGNGGATGLATAEVIDVSGTTNSRLANISTRAVAGTGNRAIVAGFTIDGPSAQKVILRGLGPTLAFSDRLLNPTVRLRDSNENSIVFNDNWKDTQEAEIQASGLPPPDNRESAIVATLAPGSYTAELAGVCNSTGRALVEVYVGFGSAVSIPASSALPVCVTPSTVVSRRTHGGTGIFDVALPVADSLGVECRGNAGASNDFQLVFAFPSPVTFTGAAVSVGNGAVLSVTGSGSATATVNLTGVADAQVINVTLTGVSNGTLMNDVVVPMGVLVGDTNGDRFVNAGDTLQTRNRSGQLTDAMNFRSDVNVDGFINSGDTTAVRSRSGTFVP